MECPQPERTQEPFFKPKVTVGYEFSACGIIGPYSFEHQLGQTVTENPSLD